jgi:hypothetical protein
MPVAAVQGRRRKIVVEQIGDDLVGEQFDAAIGMMNDEPLAIVSIDFIDDVVGFRPAPRHSKTLCGVGTLDADH